MPKASPALGWRTTWRSTESTISFADDAQEEILTWVGLTPTDERAVEVIARVKSVLGDYDGLVHVLDNAPRPANQIAALDGVINYAELLSKSLQGLDSKTSVSSRRSCATGGRRA